MYVVCIVAAGQSSCGKEWCHNGRKQCDFKIDSGSSEETFTGRSEGSCWKLGCQKHARELSHWNIEKSSCIGRRWSDENCLDLLVLIKILAAAFLISWSLFCNNLFLFSNTVRFGQMQDYAILNHNEEEKRLKSLCMSLYYVLTNRLSSVPSNLCVYWKRVL